MKKALILTIATLYFCIIYSQEWEQFYGLPNRSEGPKDLLQLYDDGFYITGTYLDDLTHGWNIKTDIKGAVLYDKSISHSLYSIELLGSVSDSLGNVYSAGVIFLDNSWPLVTKYNACGEKEWCKVFQNDNYEDGVGWDIVIDGDGNLVVLVSHNSNDQVDQIFLYCLSSDGELLLIQPYASQLNHPLIGAANGYKLYNIASGFLIDGYCYWPYPGNPNQVFLRPLFIKIDSLFNEEWILPFGVSDSIVGLAHHTIPLNDSVFIGVGVCHSSEYNQNSLLMFFDKDGEELGFNQISNSSFGENVEFNTTKQIVKANDTAFISKYYLGINDTVYHGEMVIDTSGTIHKIKDRGAGYGSATIIRTNDENFLEVVGKKQENGLWDIWMYKFDLDLEPAAIDSTSLLYDSLCSFQIPTGTIDISNCFIWTDVSEYFSFNVGQGYTISAYPNPSNSGIVAISYAHEKTYPITEMRCFNVYGKMVYSEKIQENQRESVINTESWPEGIYLVIVYLEGQPVGRVKIVVK